MHPSVACILIWFVRNIVTILSLYSTCIHILYIYKIMNFLGIIGESALNKYIKIFISILFNHFLLLWFPSNTWLYIYEEIRLYSSYKTQPLFCLILVQLCKNSIIKTVKKFTMTPFVETSCSSTHLWNIYTFSTLIPFILQ